MDALPQDDVVIVAPASSASGVAPAGSASGVAPAGSASGVAPAANGGTNVAAQPPSIFERSRSETGGRYRTFLLPGASYVGWHPVSGNGDDASGVGLEISFVRWLSTDVYVGGLVQAERVGRNRVGFGIEAGYEYVGLELSLARELADKDGRGAQWSLQVAPFATLGMAFVSPRWIIALRRSDGAPGHGAMLVVGIKIPIVLGG